MRIGEMESIPSDMFESWQEAKQWRTGDTEKDSDRGVIFGDIAIKLAKQAGDCMPIASILADIVRSGEFGALEAGFITRIANVARLGSLN